MTKWRQDKMLINTFDSPRWQRLIQASCPDYDLGKRICLASHSSMIPDSRDRLRYCTTDDYDNCPIYLCKALRSSVPQGLDRETLVDSGK